MKASPIITVHYRNSICTITAVQTMLTYIVETTYSWGVPQYAGVWTAIAIPCAEPYTPNIINQGWYIGSISSKPLLEKQHLVRITDGKAKLPQLAEDPYLLTSSSKVSLQNIRLGCAWIFYSHLYFPLNITLGLYVLSTTLTNPSYFCNILCWPNFIPKIFLRHFTSPVYTC
jgi:hypothetical protein